MVEKGFVFRKSYFYLFFVLVSLFPLVPYYFYPDYFLFVFSGAGLGAICLVRSFEKMMQKTVGHLVKRKVEKHSLSQEKEEIVQLTRQIEELKATHEFEKGKKIEEMKEAYLEYEDIKKENQRMSALCVEIQKSAHEQILQKEALESEYQQTIFEQRGIIEKHKRYISLLESKIHDLTFEIRSLLQLEKPLPPDKTLPRLAKDESLNYVTSKTSSTYDLSFTVRKYISIAENFKGAETLGNKNGLGRRFLGIGYDNFSLDLRHLFESFRDETSGIVFIYSLAENKMLFANNFVKTALGYSSDKFVNEFPSLVAGGAIEWNGALQKILAGSDQKFKLLLNTKTKKEMLFQGLIGPIKTGPFANHAIGILSRLN